MAEQTEWDTAPAAPGTPPAASLPPASYAIEPALLAEHHASSIPLNQHPPSPGPNTPPAAYPFLTQPYLPPLPFAGTPSTSAPAQTSVPLTMPIIQFDPKASPSDDEEEEDDDDSSAGMSGRPKKRKSVVNLRAANAAGASSSANTANAGPRGAAADDDDKSRRKIQIEYIEEKSKRHITFSKRKAGIMKKAYELSTLTGTQVLLLVVSESGWVYTFTTEKFKPLVKEDENGGLSQGQKLIAACLESREASPHISSGFQPQQTTAASSGFEANSSIHGGQIALKTNQRPGPIRPMATNRRVSSRGRHHIPTAIRTDDMPPVPQLPTPLSGGYLDSALHSPVSPGGRGRSGGPPMSPVRGGGMQQQQQQQMGEYNDMLQRAEVLHMQGYDSAGQGYADPSLVFHSPPPSAHGLNLHSHESHFQQQQQLDSQYHQRMYSGDMGYSQHSTDGGNHHRPMTLQQQHSSYHSSQEEVDRYRSLGPQR